MKDPNLNFATGPDYVPARDDGLALLEAVAFGATIAFGLLAVLLVFLFCLWVGHPVAVAWAVVGAGGCYVAQMSYGFGRARLGMAVHAVSVLVLLWALFSAVRSVTF